MRMGKYKGRQKFLLMVFFATLIFNATAVENSKKNGKTLFGKSFSCIYAMLCDDMKTKLDKSLTLSTGTVSLDKYTALISRQMGVPVIPVGVSEKLDVTDKLSTGKRALELLDTRFSLRWLLHDNCIYIFPEDSNKNTKEKLDSFFASLDKNMQKKLSQPVTLIFSKGKPDKIFRIIEKATGVKIIAKNIRLKIDIVSVREPADSVLKSLAMTYHLQLQLVKRTIIVSPVKYKSGHTSLEKGKPNSASQ